MEKFLNAMYRNKDGYHLGERPQNSSVIKINANESPYYPSERVRKAVTEEILCEQNLYSDPNSTELTQAIAEYYGADQSEVYADSGSDVILAYCLLAYGKDAPGFCFPDITYCFYKTFSTFFDLPYEELPLKDNFSICAEDYCSCSRNVLLANPNAPTGLVLTPEEIERIVASDLNRLVIVDEAYADFQNKSCIPLIHRYDNLIVIQTMSKSRNLAGARIGFAVSSSRNVEDLKRMKAAFNPDSINSVSQALGCKAMKDVDSMRECVSRIVQTRDRMKTDLIIRGFEVLDSHTNFLFFKPPTISAAEFCRELKKDGVLVRHYEQPRIRDYIRMSIGTPEQMKTVLEKIDLLLAGSAGRETCERL